MKSTTVKLIKELLDSVPIEINYKNDIFLEETNNFNQYATKNMPKYKLMNDGKLDPVYAAARKAKNNISFNEVKRDIINHKGKDRLHKLEDLYIDMYSDNAIACEDDLDDFFFDEIADALNDFLDEIGKLMKKKSLKTNYIAKSKGKSRGLCLVYTNGVQPPYQYATLDNLLDKVAKAAICYCNNATDYSILSNLPDKKGKTDKDTPMYIRRVCAIICYAILRFGNYVSIKKNQTQLPSHSGVCSQIMTDLHNRCINLGYPYFTKEDKLFQYDKWSISPETMLRTRSYVPPKMPAVYAGMKEGYLGYMIARLQEQVPYKKFIDVFGGSGAASVQFRHNTNAEYYINDFNFCIVSYYRIMQTLSTSPDYIEFTEKLFFLNVLYRTAYNEASDSEDFHIFSKPIFAFYEELASIGYANLIGDINALKVLTTPLNTRTDLINAVNHVKLSIPDNIKEYCTKPISYIDAAVLFAYYMFHNVNEIICYGIYSKESLFVKDFNDINKMIKSFLSFRDVFDSTIINPLGASAMDILVSDDFNDKTTLAYIDSPYINTIGYTVDELQEKVDISPTVINEDNVGEKFYIIDFDMPALLDSIDNFKGNYIFSCRMNLLPEHTNELYWNTDKKAVQPDSYTKLILNNYKNFWRYWDKKEVFILFPYSPNTYIDLNVDAVVEREEWLCNDIKLVKCIATKLIMGYDTEVMITNFDFITPDFESMYERGDLNVKNLYNPFGKRTQAVKLNKMKNNKFVKMPIKEFTDILLRVANWLSKGI